VLFDLDGTLADTAPDMAHALNRLLRTHARPPVATERVRPFVSQGARGMLRAGFDIGPDDPSFAELREAFLDEYERDICIDTTLFDGVHELLARLEEDGLTWGIVTNKAARFTLPLLKFLDIDRRAACIVCGDTCARAKPHPDPLLHAASHIAIAPEECLYIGDDERDIQAANAAGMRGVVALYGYLGTGTPPAQWKAAAMVEAPLDVITLL